MATISCFIPKFVRHPLRSHALFVMMLLPLAVLCTSCDHQNDRSGYVRMIIYDYAIRKETVKDLKSAKIPIKVEGDVIWYPGKDQIEVQKISDRADEASPVPVFFSILSDCRAFANKLSAIKIANEVHDDANKKRCEVYIPRESYKNTL